jgi:hypothetical protein
MTAAGAVCAESIGFKVVAVDVGWSRLAGSAVARQAIYDREPAGEERLIISFGESLALAMSTGLPLPGHIGDGQTNDLYTKAAEAIVAFGRDRFIGLVDALEDIRRIGVYRLAWPPPN